MKRNIDHLSTREKLLELAAVLEKVPAERFNMRVWAEGPEEPTLDHLTGAFAREQQSCGTAACAAGVAACAFEGLHWAKLASVTDSYGNQQWGIVVERASDRITRTPWTHGGFGGLASFFGIAEVDANRLFSIGGYAIPWNQIKPHHVIARLHEVAAKY